MSTSLGWWTITGWAFGLIGMLFGIFGWWAWKNPRAIRLRLAWSATDEVVFKGDVDPGVKLQVDGQPVACLSRSVLTLVNIGHGSIRSTDLTETRETPSGTLLVKFSEGTRPLRVRVVDDEASHVLAQAEIHGHAVRLRFGLLERNDVLQFEILHDGARLGQPPDLVGHIINGDIGSFDPQAQKAAAAKTLSVVASAAVPGGGYIFELAAALVERLGKDHNKE